MRYLIFAFLLALFASTAAAQAQSASATGQPVAGEPMYILMSRAPVVAVCLVKEGNAAAPGEPAAAAEKPAATTPLRPTISCKVVRALSGVKDGETIKVVALPAAAPSTIFKADEKWLLFMRAAQQGQYPVVRAAKVVDDQVTDFQIKQSEAGDVVAPGQMPLADAITALTEAINDHTAALKYDVSPEAKTDDQLLADIGDNEELNLRIVGALIARRACPQILKLAKAAPGDRRLHATIIYGLEQCPGKETEDLLVGLLKSDDIVLVSAAARSLAGLKSTRAIDALLAVAKAQDGLLPFDVARALAATGDPRAIEPLLEARKRAIAAEDEAPPGRRHPWLRAEYLRLLGDFDDPRVAEAIQQDLQSDDRAVALVAAEILYRHGDPAGLARLIAMLEADTSYANQSIIIAKLVGMGAIEASPALIKLLKSEDGTIRAHAANALRQLSAREDGCTGCGEDAAKWQEWWDKRQAK